jgi:acetylornithine deacetylase/succinyl-diaminopimelate desuccinylase-like protein
VGFTRHDHEVDSAYGLVPVGESATTSGEVDLNPEAKDTEERQRHGAMMPVENRVDQSGGGRFDARMNVEQARAQIDRLWDESIVPTLTEYIRIPNQSPVFDKDWEAHGFMDEAVELARKWVESRNIPNSTLEVLRLEGRTPLLLLDIEGQRDGHILMYGHLDKQPPFEGWRTDEGLGPWTPVYRDGKLYGRGGADDGYAIFGSVAAIEALQAQNIPHPRVVVAIECSEESGSPDLPFYIDKYADKIGAPDLVVCLDSGAGDYERLWATTSLRGIIAGDLKVHVLRDGVHSGDASGVVPSSFRVLRSILSRLEDPETGNILPEQLHIEIPEERVAQAHLAAEVLGTTVTGKYPYYKTMGPVDGAPGELLLNRTWRPALSVTGVDGMPTLEQAGNVLRPFTAVKLSLRIPPGVDADVATEVLTRTLTENPPYGATVTFHAEKGAAGWEAPPTAPWLEEALSAASHNWYDAPHAAMGEGGSIPFMGMLGEKFPKAQFLITGVLGPESNAHGPNEFLHVPFAKRLTGCVADIISRLP